MTALELVQKFSPDNHAVALIVLLSRGEAMDEQDRRDKIHYCAGMVLMMAQYGDITTEDALEITAELGRTSWPLRNDEPRPRPHLQIVR